MRKKYIIYNNLIFLFNYMDMPQKQIDQAIQYNRTFSNFAQIIESKTPIINETPHKIFEFLLTKIASPFHFLRLPVKHHFLKKTGNNDLSVQFITRKRLSIIWSRQ